MDDPSSVRLQRYLAMAGVGSRRKCEELITAGRVTVDRQTVTELGTKIDPETQEVRLDGERLRVERPAYYLLNKPVGYLCTNSDPQGRPRAVDLLPRDRGRLFTVGRLDEHSQGLLLATNDGELAHRLAHPRFRVRKRYEVQVAGVPTRELIEQLTRGLYFPEGRFKAAEARVVKVQKQSTLIEIVLTEGQNREIRRMLARLGHKVQRLNRVALGPVELGDVPPGHYRLLAPPEIKALRDLTRQTGRRRHQTGKGRGRKPAAGGNLSRKPGASASHRSTRKPGRERTR